MLKRCHFLFLITQYLVFIHSFQKTSATKVGRIDPKLIDWYLDIPISNAERVELDTLFLQPLSGRPDKLW